MKKNAPLSSLLCALAALAMCSSAIAHPGGANAPSPDLPPIIPEGYLSPADVHAKYSGPALEIVLSMVEHQPFAELDPDVFLCNDPGGTQCDEHHHFDSQLHAMVSVNGSPSLPMEMQGPVMTVAFGKGPGDATGTFDTEMLSMSLSGINPFNPTGPLVMVRESPTKASTGVTSITDIGGAMWHIDSFFDVWTELSLDGGVSWMPSNVGSDGESHPTRVYLGGIPEPASAALLALGMLGLAGLARRRR